MKKVTVNTFNGGKVTLDVSQIENISALKWGEEYLRDVHGNSVIALSNGQYIYTKDTVAEIILNCKEDFPMWWHIVGFLIKLGLNGWLAWFMYSETTLSEWNSAVVVVLFMYINSRKWL